MKNHFKHIGHYIIYSSKVYKIRHITQQTNDEPIL